MSQSIDFHINSISPHDLMFMVLITATQAVTTKHTQTQRVLPEELPPFLPAGSHPLPSSEDPFQGNLVVPDVQRLSNTLSLLRDPIATQVELAIKAQMDDSRRQAVGDPLVVKANFVEAVPPSVFFANNPHHLGYSLPKVSPSSSTSSMTNKKLPPDLDTHPNDWWEPPMEIVDA